MAVNSGLEGIVAAETRLSEVDGERGELVIAGFPVGEIAAHASFEETTWLLWHGGLPTAPELDAFRAELAGKRSLPRATVELIHECARQDADTMDLLRMAVGTLSLNGPRMNTDEHGSDDAEEAAALVARCPTIVATYWRLRRGEQPLAPRADLGHAANFLYMLAGAVPDPERVRGLETYLNTVVDHGLKRVDLHRARDHVNRIRSRLRDRRRTRRVEGTAARRRARPRARHGF